MDVKQIATLVNDSYKESTGREELLKDDYSNLVDMGSAVFDSGSKDKYCGSLVDKIGKMVFVSRKYTGFGYTLVKDGWEYGAVLQKVDTEIPEAEVNESWELVDGASYDPHIFRAPKVNTKFYNKYVTFEVDRSITDKQLRSAFNSMAEMNSFVTMIFNAIENSFTIAQSNLARGLVNNAIAETLNAEYQGASFSSTSHTKAINLLYEFNQMMGDTPLTADKALYNLDFLKFASNRILETCDRMRENSSLFNVGGKDRFTPADMQRIILHSSFKRKADTYLQSAVFHNEFTKLPEAETTSYWQGTGSDYAFGTTSKVKVHTASGTDVECSGILGILYDKDALGINNEDRHTTTQYNAKAEFTNYFYKAFAQYYTDLNENIVVFFIA